MRKLIIPIRPESGRCAFSLTGQQWFEIGQSNEIIKTGKVYDLHNIYEFVGVFLNAKERRLRLLFEPSAEYRKHQLSIILSFEEIDYLEFSPNFG